MKTSNTGKDRPGNPEPSSLEEAVRVTRTETAVTPASSALRVESDDGDMRRRELLFLLGATAALPIAQRAEAIRTTFSASFSAPATELDSDAWERLAFDYAHEVGVLADDEVLSNILCDLDEINTLIGTVTGQVRLRLLHTGAQLAALTAITLTNLGAGREARRWWRTAARAADQSGDGELGSAVRGRQAVFALYEDRPLASTLGIAEEAIRVGGNRPIVGVISGYAARAQALGYLGRHDEAEGAFKDLVELFDRLPEGTREDRRSQWGWSVQRLHHVDSHVHTFSGKFDLAARAQNAALSSYPVRSSQGRTQIEIYRAGSLFRSGDVHEGSRHLASILSSLPAARRKDGLLRRTAVAALALAPIEAASHPGTMQVRELLTLTWEQDDRPG